MAVGRRGAWLLACAVLACGGGGGGGSGGSGVPGPSGSTSSEGTGTDGSGVQTSTDASDGSSGDDGAESSTGTGGEEQPGAWELPDGYYVPAKMPMTIVHPRDDESPSWAYGKNAHPGIHWEVPIVVQGGAWPFRYEIVDDGGATGLGVGGELERTLEDGFVVHRVTEDYGVLWWSDPQPGQFDIAVRVTDQDGAQVEVPIALTVGTEGWVFIDAESGDDGNGGTVDAPFASLAPLYGDPSPYAQSRVYLAGLVPMDGNQDNGNLRIAAAPASDADLAPRVWVGLPGRTAILEAHEGRIVLDAPDFYMANLEHRHREDYVQDDGTPVHMFTVWERASRFTTHEVTWSRFQGVPVNTGLGNSSVMMFTRGGQPHEHVAVVGCTFTGASGILTSTYTLRHSVFEKNRGVDADFELSDGSVWALFYIKGDNEYVTLRANEFWDRNTWNGPNSAIGLQEARNVELAYNTIDMPAESGRAGTLKLWTNSPVSGFSWTEDTPVWIYRNSLRRRISFEGDALVNMPDATVQIERNVLDTGLMPVHELIVNSDNLDGEGYLDAQMKLAPAYRPEHLGRVGAEIAVPEAVGRPED
jgi:hypothetical protein